MTGTRSKYVELIEEMDIGIGRVLATLEDVGLSDSTLVVFASDNGAMAPGSNRPFRDYKSKLFEGGIRVPLIARWKGRIPPGAVSRQVCITMDLTRSFIRIAEGREPAYAA